MAKAVRVRVSPTAPFNMFDAYQGVEQSIEYTENMNIEQYLPVILFILVGISVGVMPQLIGYILGPNKPDAAKNSPYECGFEAFGDARMKFDVRYYLIAILFILFDLETALLFPWAIALKDLGLFGFLVGLEIVTILTIGFVYMWIKGALDWE